jgi:hypothetical protein
LTLPIYGYPVCNGSLETYWDLVAQARGSAADPTCIEMCEDQTHYGLSEPWARYLAAAANAVPALLDALDAAEARVACLEAEAEAVLCSVFWRR